MTAKCQCQELPEIVRFDDRKQHFQKMQVLEKGDWVRLLQCLICSQLWSLDEWDKYQTQFAIKLARREGWQEFDTAALRKQYLVQSRGGVTDEPCIWSGCTGHRVRGVVYCADHLYKTGARE